MAIKMVCVKSLGLIFFLVLHFFHLNAQNIKGRVVDNSNGQPIGYANVVVLHASDSSFVTGTTTDDDGYFIIEVVPASLLKISFIGYEVRIIAPQQTNTDVIRLQADNKVLKEVTVTANRRIFKMDAGGVTANIQNSVLSKIGNANDVLNQLPFVSGEDGKVTVFGKGTPLVYVNNRLLRDNSELRRLKSDEIKSIKVITNPGAEYDATVNAVIRIRTVKPVGEGVSGTLYADVTQNREFSHNEFGKINYRKGGFDLFGSIDYIENRNNQNQDINQVIYTEQVTSLVKNSSNERRHNKNYNATVGINHDVNKVSSWGVRYNLAYQPSDLFDNRSDMSFYQNDIEKELLNSVASVEHKNRNHYVNAYYNGITDKIGIYLNIDYAKGKHDESQQAFDYAENGDKQEVHTKSNRDYDLYAGKLLVSLPLGKEGSLSFGGEYAYTLNEQNYLVISDEVTEDLHSNTNEAEQNLAAGFVSYSKGLNKFSLNAGLRFEYVKFNYLNNGEKVPEQSKTYKSLFPNLSIAYSGDQVQMQLSYKNSIERPSYTQLRNHIQYDGPFAYESGNPYLKPLRMNSLSYMLGWKDIQFMAAYNMYHNGIVYVVEQFEDKNILLFRTVNKDEYRDVTAAISYSPTFGIWSPTFEVNVAKQFFKYGTEQVKLNKPLFGARLNNRFKLPEGFILLINFSGNTRGYSSTIYGYENFNVNVYLMKSFFEDRLRFSLKGSDLLGTNREKWRMKLDNVSMSKWNDANSRGVLFSVSYFFNKASNKYKGEGAASGELERLK